MKQLILGGARSGKSRMAEEQALESGKKRVYIATGVAGDDEMAERIAIHQQSRGEGWTLVEEPVELARALKEVDGDSNAIVVDCLTLWLSNCLARNCLQQESTQFLECLPHFTSDIFLVSNEVGMGVVPMGKISRDFVDHSGWLHQALALICDRVTLMVAGLPFDLKKPD